MSNKNLVPPTKTERLPTISGGVVNPKIYAVVKPRIAWVLKEPYDDFDEQGNPCGGGWSMSEIYLYPEVLNSLRSVVHMNISKFPGRTTTYWGNISSYYDLWHSILLFQLKVYKLQVVVFGNVSHFFIKISDLKKYYNRIVKRWWIML